MLGRRFHVKISEISQMSKYLEVQIELNQRKTEIKGTTTRLVKLTNRKSLNRLKIRQNVLSCVKYKFPYKFLYVSLERFLFINPNRYILNMTTLGVFVIYLFFYLFKITDSVII